MIRSESIAPDHVIEWSDADLAPANDNAAVCFLCGKPATVVRIDPFCAECDAEDSAPEPTLLGGLDIPESDYVTIEVHS